MPPIDYLCDSIESGSTTVIDHGNRPVEVEGVAEPSQETEIEGPSRNFDAHGSEFSIDDLEDRKVEFEPVQIGQRTPSIHQEASTKNSQVINDSDFSGDLTILWSTNTDVMAIDAPRQELVEKTNELQTQFEFPMVTFESLCPDKKEVASQISVGIDETIRANHEKFNVKEMELADFRMVAMNLLGISVAHKVFVEMSGRVESLLASAAAMVKRRVQDGNLVFDPGITQICIGLGNFLKTCVHTVLKMGRKMSMPEIEGVDCISTMNNNCDGFLLEFESLGKSRVSHENRVVIDAWGVFDGLKEPAVFITVVFDPGGI